MFMVTIPNRKLDGHYVRIVISDWGSIDVIEFKPHVAEWCKENLGYVPPIHQNYYWQMTFADQQDSIMFTLNFG